MTPSPYSNVRIDVATRKLLEELRALDPKRSLCDLAEIAIEEYYARVKQDQARTAAWEAANKMMTVPLPPGIAVPPWIPKKDSST